MIHYFGIQLSLIPPDGVASTYHKMQVCEQLHKAAVDFGAKKIHAGEACAFLLDANPHFVGYLPRTIYFDHSATTPLVRTAIAAATLYQIGTWHGIAIYYNPDEPVHLASLLSDDGSKEVEFLLPES